ncbi:AlpA family phage regulatory protein [Aquabacter sp. CN5-332]|uniref:helix-turn-helix transcriptional regulator n=1 Tax=Aquabacter sp. CN5-332 TaxID=3156608 RepID=UPI0032B3DF30
MNDNSPLMSLNEVVKYTSLSKAFILVARDEGLFPQSIKLGVRRIAFVRAEVVAWVEARVAARGVKAAA